MDVAPETLKKDRIKYKIKNYFNVDNHPLTDGVLVKSVLFLNGTGSLTLPKTSRTVVAAILEESTSASEESSMSFEEISDFLEISDIMEKMPPLCESIKESPESSSEEMEEYRINKRSRIHSPKVEISKISENASSSSQLDSRHFTPENLNSRFSLDEPTFCFKDSNRRSFSSKDISESEISSEPLIPLSSEQRLNKHSTVQFENCLSTTTSVSNLKIKSLVDQVDFQGNENVCQNSSCSIEAILDMKKCNSTVCFKLIRKGVDKEREFNKVARSFVREVHYFLTNRIVERNLIDPQYMTLLAGNLESLRCFALNEFKLFRQINDETSMKSIKIMFILCFKNEIITHYARFMKRVLGVLLKRLNCEAVDPAEYKVTEKVINEMVNKRKSIMKLRSDTETECEQFIQDRVSEMKLVIFRLPRPTYPPTLETNDFVMAKELRNMFNYYFNCLITSHPRGNVISKVLSEVVPQYV